MSNGNVYTSVTTAVQANSALIQHTHKDLHWKKEKALHISNVNDT